MLTVQQHARILSGVSKKSKPPQALTRTNSKVIGVRLTKDLKGQIEVDFRRRLRVDETVPEIYTIAEHIRFLIRTGLYHVRYPSKQKSQL